MDIFSLSEYQNFEPGDLHTFFVSLFVCVLGIYMSHDTTKRVFGSFRPGQTQTGLRSHGS